MVLSTFKADLLNFKKVTALLVVFCTFGVGLQVQANEMLYESSSFFKSSDKLNFHCQESLLECPKQSILWSAESSGRSYSDRTDDSYVYGLKFSAQVRYRLLDELEFFGQMNMNFRSGRVQSRFGDFTPDSVYLGYGYLQWKPANNEIFSLRTGALKQSVFFMPFFMAKRSFPGLSEHLKLFGKENKKFSFDVSAQQVIPTSYTFNTDLIEKEKMPSLLAVRTFSKYRNKYFDLRATLGLFSFSNLPSKVADQSRFTGNTIRGTNAASEFAFDFEGWMAEFFIKYKLNSSTAFGFALDMLENTAAAETFNQSQVIRLSASKRLNQKIGLDLTLGNYFIESDAMPAYYTSTNFGNTNRKGNFIEMGMEWVPQKFRISASYSKADLINESTTGAQYDADFIFINLETAYDSFL